MKRLMLKQAASRFALSVTTLRNLPQERKYRYISKYRVPYLILIILASGFLLNSGPLSSPIKETLG